MTDAEGLMLRRHESGAEQGRWNVAPLIMGKLISQPMALFIEHMLNHELYKQHMPTPIGQTADKPPGTL